MIPRTAKLYCREDVSHIENYCLAKADNSKTWHCHHRLEDKGYTGEQLVDMQMYYGRPANELIFLTPSEHISRHHKGKPKSEEHKAKISKSRKGKYNTKNVAIEVYQYSKNGDFIKKFKSCKDVERKLGFNASAISKCCRKTKNYKTVHGYIFSYEPPKLKTVSDIKPLF